MSKPIFTHVIERARAYVAVRSTWTRYTLALTGNNRDCEPTDAKTVRAFARTVRWCARYTRPIAPIPISCSIRNCSASTIPI